MFNINTTSDKAIYEQIIDNIKELTIRNILKTEDKLPSVRQMASILSVNPNTVSKAYQELERQKIIHTVRGRGSFISSDEDIPIDNERIAKALENLRNNCIELGHLGFDKGKIISEVEKIYNEIEKGGTKW